MRLEMHKLSIAMGTAFFILCFTILNAVSSEWPYGASMNIKVDYPAKNERSLIFSVLLENHNKKALCVPRAKFPTRVQKRKLFIIYDDAGNELEYVGIRTDMAGPIREYLVIPPGEVVQTEVFVGQDYVFRSGKTKYYVTYQVVAYNCELFNKGYVEIWDGERDFELKSGEFFTFRVLEIPFEY